MRRRRGLGMVLVVGGLLGFVACGEDTGAAGPGADARAPADRSDASEVDAAQPDAPESCVAFEPKRCSGEAQLERCNAEGTGSERLDCALGCTGGRAPHCRSFRPHAPVLAEDLAIPELSAVAFSGSLELDTDTGEISGIRLPNRNFMRQEILSGIGFRGEPDVGIFVFGGLTIPAGVTVRVRGRRALALVSTSDLELAGVIDARPRLGDQLCAPGSFGPGGYAGGRANGPGTQGDGEGDGGGDKAPVFGTQIAYGGGGGGGHGGGGGAGAGARATQEEIRQAGGSGGLSQFFTYPVEGGGGGGSGSGSARGGGGGGGVHLAAAGRLRVGEGEPAGINVSGCGGQAGGPTPLVSPGGGGAGGAIVIEAAIVELGSRVALVANGGGGGGGTPGSTSGFEREPAAGGAATGGFGRGGVGGSRDRARGETPPDPPSASAGGGGGGGSGLISFFDGDGVIDVPADALLSPAFDTLDENDNPRLCVSGQVVPIE